MARGFGGREAVITVVQGTSVRYLAQKLKLSLRGILGMKLA